MVLDIGLDAMHTSVLTPAQDALSPTLPLSRRPIPVCPVCLIPVGAQENVGVGEPTRPVSWREALDLAAGMVPDPHLEQERPTNPLQL